MKYVEDRWEFDGRNRVIAIGVGLIPLWMLVIAAFASPHMGGGMYQPTAAQAIARDRVQLVVFGLAGILMLAGTIALWRARSERVAVAATLLLTLPAVLVALFAPAFLLILVNLTK